MKNIRTKVVHSESKTAWNVVGEELGKKHKRARIPYHLCDNDIIDTRQKHEALEHAMFIRYCFNHAELIDF